MHPSITDCIPQETAELAEPGGNSTTPLAKLDGMSAAKAAGMQTITIPQVPSFESINTSALSEISGGCHHGCCSPCNMVQSSPTFVFAPQMTQTAAPAVPQVAAPAVSAPTSSVSTSVSINGVPQASA